jgi:hypothetical protein
VIAAAHKIPSKQAKIVIILTNHLDAVINPLFYYFINKEIRDGVLNIFN